MANFLILTHGEFGAYAVEAAEGIVGEQEGVRSVPVTARMPLEEARARVAAALEELGGEVVILTDIPGGTPANLALTAARGRGDVAVLSGLNLYMLVTAFSNRALPLPELTQKLLKNAANSIVDLDALLKSRAKAAAR